MKTYNGYVLGRVKEGFSSIYINSYNSVQVLIEMLSTPPANYNGDLEIHAYTNNLTPLGFEDDDFSTNTQERVQNAEAFLEDSLLFFKIEQTPTGYYRATTLDMRPTKLNTPIAAHYETIPIYNGSAVGEFNEVLVALKTNKVFSNHKDMITNQRNSPDFLLYRHADGPLIAIGPIMEQQYSHGGFRYIFKENNLRSFPLSEQLQNKLYLYNDLAFASTEVNEEILTLLASPTSLHMTDEAITQLQNSQNAYKQAYASEASTQVAVAEEKEITLKPSKETVQEDRFLKQLDTCLKYHNLHYNPQDILHFHTTMKSKGLTILSGISGTGKSQLVHAYTEALGLTANEFSIIPVSSSWIDETDLLGYVDIQQKQYIPAATGLASLLLQAERNPQKMHMVCFDEMNLAKVEHYFSQFLSVLEIDVHNENRQIRLYSEELESELTNSADFPANIRIYDNVAFVGTVNTDESVHRFSDKVLDRAHIIQLTVEPFNLMLLDAEPFERNLAIEPFDLQEFMKETPTFTLSKEQVDFLWSLNELLNDCSTSLGFGPRIVKQINDYMAQVTESPLFTQADAFDLQLTARIFPKLRGSEDTLRPLIGIYDVHSKTVRQSALIELFNNYQNLSHFSRAIQKITNKSKELASYGYTM
ncbi:MAG: AAA family ATPase [Kurthia sp.]|nr:AAA family ATPase [Candidatus Kurthia equi]